MMTSLLAQTWSHLLVTPRTPTTKNKTPSTLRYQNISTPACCSVFLGKNNDVYHLSCLGIQLLRNPISGATYNFILFRILFLSRDLTNSLAEPGKMACKPFTISQNRHCKYTKTSLFSYR